jgi:hypothetical protein
VAGDSWVNTTVDSVRVFSGGGQVISTIGSVFHTASQSGDAIANTLTETNFTVASTIVFGTIPANAADLNRAWRISAAGTCGSAAGTATLTIRVKVGATTFLTLVLTPATGASGKWSVEAWVFARTTGSSGTVQGDGSGWSNGVSVAVDNQSGLTMNTTVANNVFLTGQWSVASASNTAKITRFSMEAILT